MKKTFTAYDFDEPNNAADNATDSNTANDNAFGEKNSFLKLMLYLSTAFQKLMEYKLIIQKIQML